MTNSHNSTSTESCFSGIFRRLLCTGSLPTHPSDPDHLPEFNKTDFIPKKNEHEVKGGGTQGLVARLMGLDSLPADMTWLPNKDHSIHFRSRSLNSADYLSPFDRAAQESYHRRLRTSVSFREIPTTFLVCFDKKGDGDQGLKIMAAKVAGADQVKRSTSGNKYSNTKKEKVVVVKKKENRETNKRKVDHKRNSLRVVQNINVLAHNKSNDVYVKSSMKMKRSAKPVNLSKEEKVSVGIIKRSKQRVLNPSRAKKVEEPEHSSVDSTPDSIGIISGKKNSTPKVVDKHFGYPCVNYVRKSINAAVHGQEEVRRAIHSTTKSEKLRSRRRMREIEFYINKLVEVCRLTDEDTKVSNNNNNNWPWISSRSDQVIEFDDYQDIFFDFGQEILEMLVQQVVDQLCEQTV